MRCAISSLNLPPAVHVIEDRVFDGCIYLSTVSVNYASTIKYRAFGSCSALTSAFIGSGVTFINSEAFADCPAVSYISCGFSSGVVSGAPWGASPTCSVVYAN